MRSVNLERKTLLSDGLSAKAVAFLTQMHVVSMRLRANPSESPADHQAALILQLPLSGLCGRLGRWLYGLKVRTVTAARGFFKASAAE